MIVALKVRQIRNDFFKLKFLPKHEWTNSLLLLEDLFSFVFWKKVNTPKNNFEINQLDFLKSWKNWKRYVFFFSDFCGFLNFVPIWLNSIIHTDSNFSYSFTSFETLSTPGNGLVFEWIWFCWKMPVFANEPLGPLGSASPLKRSLVSYAASKFTSAAFSSWLLPKSRTSHHLDHHKQVRKIGGQRHSHFWYPIYDTKPW